MEALMYEVALICLGFVLALIVVLLVRNFRLRMALRSLLKIAIEHERKKTPLIAFVIRFQLHHILASTLGSWGSRRWLVDCY
jgi:hypothetical protein